ncbi:MAG: hypothetical protein LBR31_07345 [Desulfovibrio sp.]|jgi:Zn-dependent peptidase ImmA (M78 family)|nr:hypothetical protein [Desulfovibrio sp.]
MRRKNYYKLFKNQGKLFVKFYNPLKGKFEKMRVSSNKANVHDDFDDDYLACITEVKNDEYEIVINIEQFSDVLSIRNTLVKNYYIDFIILHEIGHYLLAHTLMETSPNSVEDQLIEEQADEYALNTVRTNRRLRKLIAAFEEREEPPLDIPQYGAFRP